MSMNTQLLCAVLALSSAACASNVVLRRTPAQDSGFMGPFELCQVGASACKTDPVYDSSRLNQHNTRFFPLPACPYGIHDLAVLDASSDDAQVIVRCAAPPQQETLSGGLPVTAAGGGTQP
jgi:hypothetical protein